MDAGVKDRLGDFFRRRKEIRLAYLFGSHAKGRATATSDFDVAVFLETPRHGLLKYRYQTTLAQSIEQFLRDDCGMKRQSVDVILLNETEPLLAHQVIKYGQLLFERSPRLDRDFRIHTMTRYFDSKPLRDFFFRRAMSK